jgi:hypothetical protein
MRPMARTAWHVAGVEGGGSRDAAAGGWRWRYASGAPEMYCNTTATTPRKGTPWVSRVEGGKGACGERRAAGGGRLAAGGGGVRARSTLEIYTMESPERRCRRVHDPATTRRPQVRAATAPPRPAAETLPQSCARHHPAARDGHWRARDTARNRERGAVDQDIRWHVERAGRQAAPRLADAGVCRGGASCRAPGGIRVGTFSLPLRGAHACHLTVHNHMPVV